MDLGEVSLRILEILVYVSAVYAVCAVFVVVAGFFNVCRKPSKKLDFSASIEITGNYKTDLIKNEVIIGLHSATKGKKFLRQYISVSKDFYKVFRNLMKNVEDSFGGTYYVHPKFSGALFEGIYLMTTEKGINKCLFVSHDPIAFEDAQTPEGFEWDVETRQ